MIATPWGSIDAATLESLCAQGAAESQTLDFKQGLPGFQRDDPRNEFAKDVCAFANAAGGDLVYGIAERPDGPHLLLPCLGEPFDACKRRLTEVLTNHVEPRIAGVQFKELPLGDAGYVPIVRVPQSFDGPHRFRYRDAAPGGTHHRFVVRLETQTIDMDYSQLRGAFGRTASLALQARQFRAERLEHLRRGGWPKPMLPGPKSAVHFIPLAGVAKGSIVDVPALYRAQIDFTQPGGFVPARETNLEGILMTGPTNGQDGTIDWYIQIFRSGAIELVRKAWREEREDDGGTLFIPAVFATAEVRRACATATARARDLGISGPAILELGFLEARNHPFRIERNGGAYGQSTADHDTLILPEQWIEEVASESDIDAVARPLLDGLWQCFHEVECELYDREHGRWILA